MKKYFRRFLEISARLTGTPIEKRMKDGTLGLGEYIHIIANGLILAFVLGIIFAPVYFLVIRPCGWLKKGVADALNRIRVGIPENHN